METTTTAATTTAATTTAATALEAPAACRAHFSAPARGAARARVTHIAALPQSLERC